MPEARVEPIEANKDAYARLERIAYAVANLSEVYTHNADKERTKAMIEYRQQRLSITFEEAQQIVETVQEEQVRLAMLLYKGLLR